jgi:thioredoxin reductase/CRP-like cAMP-binding protein/Fe-S-cluster-containing hydrogenase component 2
MAERFQVAIIGSGPGGLSAGGRAAALGLSHVVLEREQRYAETIQKYQRGKLVMATPDILPLRSDMSFAEGIREHILETWGREVAGQGVNIRYGAEVTKVSGKKGAFTVTLRGGEAIEAENVVLAIGVQGDLRKLDVPGDNLPFVQYQLDDPDEYANETIVVVGASDSALENALALAKQNQVVLVNRGDGFPRAKTGNVALITKAIKAGQVECLYKTTPERVEPGVFHLKTPEGKRAYPCNRIIARLGGILPTAFLKSCGIKVPDGSGPVFPEVSERYETNVPGLYAIGAIVGYPLIKQCMNQGYEVIQAIAGQPVAPADEPLLEEKLLGLPGRPAVSVSLELIKSRVRLFRSLTTLQLREFLLDSETHLKLAGEEIYRYHEFGDTLFLVVSGTVEVERYDEERPTAPPRVTLRGEGDFFGEAGLIANRPRSGTARAKTDVVVIELVRRSALKLLASVPSAREEFERTTIVRQLQEDLLPDLTEQDLAGVVATAKIERFPPGAKLVEEGAEDDRSAFLIRSGSVTISRRVEGKEVVLAYEPAGRLVGEMALLRQAPRAATVTAAIQTEAIRINGAVFRALIDSRPDLRAKVDQIVQEKLLGGVARERGQGATPITTGLLDKGRGGLGEATDVLLIDESLCIRCDNCEKACAESHDGISRLDREAGPTFAMLHVPTSCRHCEHPHCMKDCPPDAIHRGTSGEVWIDDTCIGCGNCADNCPYGVIQLAEPPPPKPGLLSWLLLGRGPGPGEDKAYKAKKKAEGPVEGAHKVAVKCDMCAKIEGGAACVRACPTGAAIRVSPAEYLNATAGLR